MAKKFKEKYNESSIKIFKFIFLLYNDDAYYDKVMNILKSSTNEKPHVILNKYLNALKVFGINVIKDKNKYKLLNTPFTKPYELEDLKTIALIENFTIQLPNSKKKNEIEKLIKTIKNSFNANSKSKYNQLQGSEFFEEVFQYSNIKQQIEKCEEYCQGQYKIKIIYDSKGKEITSICNAKQIIYGNKTAYLRIYKIKEQEIKDVAIEKIISITQLPSLKNNTELPMTIIYRITGRLAKSYNIKENERLIEVKNDGSLLIANNNEPYDKLLKRLIRYDYNCVIERPKFIKEQMMEMINNTLKNYE